ncbi:MAG: helix-turn-helix domain-containing protein, partial [Giesbergeria sp.]|nr:helix-turn-helix domain-containing protein [Giesbergeria sp.]
MPWKACNTMSLRQEFVELARQEGANRRELCRRFGISSPTAYKWEGLAKFKTATWRKHFGAQYLSTLRLSGRMRSAIASIPPWVTRSAPS